MKIAICGFGRAGQALARTIIKSKECELVAVLCRKESKNVGKDIGEILYEESAKTNIKISSFEDGKSQMNIGDIDVVIDFSNRQMAKELIAFCGELQCHLVICTTNHTVEEIGKFESMSEKLNIGIVYAPNLTIGINMLIDFVSKLASVLPDLDFEIIEKHPVGKQKPTNTAQIIAQNIGKDNIPIHSIRMKGYVSVHQVIATNGVDRISVEYESVSREAFAHSAILAAKFIKEKKGFYLMRDVIKDLETCTEGN